MDGHETTLLKALADAGERLRAIQDNVADGIVTIDEQGFIETFNRSAERMFGYAAAEVAGRNVRILMPEPYRSGHDASIARYLRTRAARVIGIGREVTGRRKDGSTFPMELRIATFEVQGQRLFTASVRDITEQTRITSALQQSEAQYRLLAENTSDMIVRADTSARRLYVSPGCREMLGFTAQELVGTNPREFVHPEDAAELGRKLEDLGRGAVDQAWNIHRFRHKDGHWVWVEVKFRLLRDRSGAPKEVFSVIRDISERHRQAEALRAAKEAAEQVADRLRLRERSLEAIGQGVVITDAQSPDNPIIYVNPAFERLTGYAAGEVVGRNCRVLQGAKTDRSASARIRAALQGGHATTETLVNYRKDGTTFVNELVISPVRDAQGLLTHFVGIQSDVTHRTEMEAQLRQAQKMEAIGQLTGGVAHDFNNLLTVILGNSEQLADELPDARLRDVAEQVRVAAERGADLTQKLLAFGRRQSLRPQRLDVGATIDGMAPLLRRTIGEHIDLRTESTGCVLALVDRTLLENVLLNLVVNARDAMPGGGTITITSGTRAAGPDEGELPIGQPVAAVTVADTGTGMTPEVLARAFEPFFTTKEVGKGSGLGLSMVYGFTQQSGGHVSIASRPGQGTSVTILLRAVDTPGEELDSAPDGGALQGTERILVVEDEPTVLGYVTSQLASLGYEVVAASSAVDALERLTCDPAFHLLLTDVVLPKGMSGAELARRARALLPGLRILLTSGYPEESFEQDERPGADTLLLRKPFNRRKLSEFVRQALLSSPRGPSVARGTTQTG